MQNSKLQLKNHTWPTKKLGEIIELRYGKGIARHDRKPNGKYPIYGANGELGRTDKFLVEGDALIIGRKGTAGEVTRVSGKFWPADVTYYVFGNDQIDVDYLFYVLKRLDLKQLATGIKPGINRNKVYELEIPLPPIEEQRRIVKKIEKLFAKIDEASRLRAESSAASAALLPSALHHIFNSKIKNQNSKLQFKIQKLSEVAKITSGGTPSRDNQNFYKGNIVWLKSGELNDNQNIEDSEEHITKEALENSNAKVFPEGTVLLAMYGATAGKLGILKKPAATNQAIAGIMPDKNRLFNRFLFYLLLHFRNEIIARAWGGAQPNISQSIIKELEIPLPPLAEQKKIVAYLDALSSKTRELQNLQAQTAADLSALRQSILVKVFKGEL